MTVEELQQQLAKTEATVRALQQELAETNHGLVALALELEQRIEERDAQLHTAHAALERSNTQLASTQATVRSLQEELAETNRGLVAVTLELEQRVDARTAELRQLNLELEARVEDRTAQLREANDNLRNFAHMAAHDLHAPLRAIKSFSSMAVEECEAQHDAEARSLLQRVTQSATQMQQLLADLLEYSKLGEQELNLEEVSLQKAARDALVLLEEDIRAKDAVVAVEDPLPGVLGHPATVVLLINNFVSNALKFIPPGRRPQICISAELVQSQESGAKGRERASSLQHTASGVTHHASRITQDDPAQQSIDPPIQSSTPFVRLWVKDNGIGIALEDRDRIFGAFQRLHGKQRYPGTGLGLAIVRRGAERMGGRVGVESEPGNGSRFWVELRSAERGMRSAA